MDNNQFSADRTHKELTTDLIKVLDEFSELEIKYLEFASQLSSAENLGQKEIIQNAQIKMMFLKQKEFYLHLRHNRIFNLILQKNVKFEFN